MLLKLITRSSKLAVWQAEHIASLLEKEGAKVEFIKIETKGDKILDTSIAKIGSKGVFTEELEQALILGKADLAVHSAKDMPSSLPEELELIAFEKREKVNDVLVSHHKGLSLDKGFKIGTSSTRRVGLLKHYFPQCEVVPMRGNLQTRFQKMENGDCDALLLAYAGVHRMGLSQYIIHEFDTQTFVPQAGQGSVTIETAKSLDEEKRNLIVKACNDFEANFAISCERSFLSAVQGGCSVPVFAHATIENEQINLTAGIVGLEGEQLIQESFTGGIDEGIQLGIDAADSILSEGGQELLTKIKLQLAN